MAGQNRSVAIDHGDGRAWWQRQGRRELIDPGEVKRGKDDRPDPPVLKDGIAEVDRSPTRDTPDLVFPEGKLAPLDGNPEVTPVGQVQRP